MNWFNMSSTNKNINKDKYFTRDFVALNCEGIKAGVTTSNETSKFRATYDKLRPIKLYTKSKTEITKPNLNITHGIINRTSTPMQEIITHKFQKDWIESQMKKMKLTHEKIETNQCNETKTFVLRAYDKTKEEKSIRKLKEFQDKATSALSTFRSEECRKRAVEMDQNEKVSRIGFDGHGIQRTRECA